MEAAYAADAAYAAYAADVADVEKLLGSITFKEGVTELPGSACVKHWLEMKLGIWAEAQATFSLFHLRLFFSDAVVEAIACCIGGVYDGRRRSSAWHAIVDLQPLHQV